MEELKQQIQLCESEIKHLNELKDLQINEIGKLRKEIWKREREGK